MYVLINKTTLEVVKTSNSVQHLGLLVEKKYPDDAIIICPVSTWTKELTVFEQIKIYTNLTGKEYKGPTTLMEVQKVLQEAVNLIPPKGKDPESTQEKTVATKAKTGEGVRPKAGTMTGLVWDIADQLSKTIPIEPWKDFKKEVLIKGEAEGINAATIQVQLGKWRASK
jgi:hypothetical protein